MERVQPGGLQPVLAPARQVATRRAPQAVQEFLQVRVAPAVPLEIVLHAALERVVADPRHQLAHHRRALVVRDPVEVLAHRNGVGNVVGDLMGGDQLVLARRDRFDAVRKVDPRVREAGRLLHREVRHVRRERLVEPQVAPPAHRGDVAETVDVRHLVEDRLRPPLQLRLARLTAVDVRLVEGDAARILHRAHVEFGHEQLVVLVERIGQPEVLLEEIEPGGRDLEDLIRLGVDPRGK